MTDVLKVRNKGYDTHFVKSKVTRLPLLNGGAALIKLDRAVVVPKGKLITIKGTAVIEDENPPKPKVPTIVSIPKDNDWTSHGVAIKKGASGRWDHRFEGQHSTADAIVLPDGSVALYYVGAKGKRDSDGGPAFRALGMALSEDGLKSFKKVGRPIITFAGGGNINQEEEGVFSCAVVQTDEVIWMFYGAIKATGKTSVDVDIYVAQSFDGVHFTGHHRIPGILTSRGELWPFSAVYVNEMFYLWVGRRDRIDVLSGTNPYKLRHQQPSGLKPSNDREIGTSVVRLGRNKLAAIYDDTIRVSMGLAGSKSWRSVGKYGMPEGHQGKCWLIDRSRNRWLLYVTHDNDKEIRIWSAPIK